MFAVCLFYSTFLTSADGTSLTATPLFSLALACCVVNIRTRLEVGGCNSAPAVQSLALAHISLPCLFHELVLEANVITWFRLRLFERR